MDENPQLLQESEILEYFYQTVNLSEWAELLNALQEMEEMDDVAQNEQNQNEQIAANLQGLYQQLIIIDSLYFDSINRLEYLSKSEATSLK